MALKLRRLSYALGAEVCDIDVSKPMGEAQFGEIYRAFLQYGILLFRNQDITREEHINFSRRFGELDRHDSLPRDRRADHPELLMVTNEPNPDGSPSDTRYTGRQWHSDMSFTTVPSLGSLLRCYAVPEVGGDTLFANMYAAYDALSDGMKKLIAGLHGIQLSGTRKIANEESGVVRGVRYRGEGGEHELRATLTVGADGRFSKLRKLSGLGEAAIRASPPMDVLWFRLPRKADDPHGLMGRIGAGHLLIELDRGEEWQIAFIIRKDSYSQLRAAGIEVRL